MVVTEWEASTSETIGLFDRTRPPNIPLRSKFARSTCGRNGQPFPLLLFHETLTGNMLIQVNMLQSRASRDVTSLQLFYSTFDT